MSDLVSKLRSERPSPVPGHAQMIITRCEQQFVVSFSDGTRLGEANAQLEKALTGIHQLLQYHVDLEVFAPIIEIHETINRATTGKEAIVRVNVNIYGSRSSSHSIGQELSNKKIYLQRPDYVRPNTIYDNPHVLKLEGFALPTRSQDIIEIADEKRYAFPSYIR